jgi:putative phage-type endonuclease
MDNETRLQWLAERQKGIGGSDIAGIIGISKYSTPLKVWKSKVEPVVEFENEYTKAGKTLEKFVADWFADITNLPLRIAEQENYTDHIYPYFKASVDRLINNDTVVEIKTTSRLDDITKASYIAQLQWYLGVLDKPQGVLVIVTLPHGFDYNEFNSNNWTDNELKMLRTACKIESETIYRNENYIKVLRDEAHKFWHLYVLTNEPPPMRTAEDAMLLYPFHEPGKYISANLELSLRIQELRDLKEKIKELENEKDQIEVDLKTLFADNEAIIYNGNTLATYKTSQVSRIDTKLLRADYPEIAEKCNKISTERRLLIKKI